MVSPCDVSQPSPRGDQGSQICTGYSHPSPCFPSKLSPFSPQERRGDSAWEVRELSASNRSECWKGKPASRAQLCTPGSHQPEGAQLALLTLASPRLRPKGEPWARLQMRGFEVPPELSASPRAAFLYEFRDDG